MELSPRLDKALSPSKTHRSVEARAIYYAASAFLVSLITGLLFFGTSVPIFGAGSIGTAALFLAAIFVFAGYFYVAYQVRERPKKPTLWQRFRLILTTLALAFIHGAIAFLLLTLIFFLVQDAFTGLYLDKYASSIILGATVGLSAYAAYLIAARVSTLLVSTALAVFLVAGALVSMMTANDPYWWQVHLSSLGAGSGVSQFAFNVTLIVGGLVIISIADFVANDFARLKLRDTSYRTTKVNLIRFILILIGIFFAFVGLFKYDVYGAIHGFSAGIMVLLFIGLIAGLPWLVPSFSKAFFTLSYTLTFFLVIAIFLFKQVNYLNVTAFEIVSFVLIFAWLVIFIRQIAAALKDQGDTKKI